MNTSARYDALDAVLAHDAEYLGYVATVGAHIRVHAYQSVSSQQAHAAHLIGYLLHLVALGIIGTALGGLATAGGGLNLLGGMGGGCGGGCGGGYGGGYGMQCSENMLVNRYEAGQAARIAELETEVKLRDANIYTDGKTLELYQYIDGRLRSVEAQIAGQAVQNQKTEDAFALVRCDIARERDERCCADNAIVNYANATFYPKMVADVTTGTTTTAQSVYNPIPSCGCCGK